MVIKNKYLKDNYYYIYNKETIITKKIENCIKIMKKIKQYSDNIKK